MNAMSDKFNLTADEREAATSTYDLDPEPDARRLTSIGAFLAIVAVLVLGALLITGVHVTILTSAIIAAFALGIAIRWFTLEPVKYGIETMRSDQWIEERMARVREQRAGVATGANGVRDRLNAEAFQVPTWARLGVWSWAMPNEHRLSLGNVWFTVTLTATKAGGATTSRDVEFHVDTGVSWDLAYPSIRSRAIEHLGRELHSLANELGIIEPTAPAKASITGFCG